MNENKKILDVSIYKINRIINRQINEILHHPIFQNFESSWRGIMRINFRDNIIYKILALKPNSINKDLHKTKKSLLYQKLYIEHFEQPGCTPFSLILMDFKINDFTSLSNIARLSFTPILVPENSLSFSLPFVYQIKPKMIARNIWKNETNCSVLDHTWVNPIYLYLSDLTYKLDKYLQNSYYRYSEASLNSLTIVELNSEFKILDGYELCLNDCIKLSRFSHAIKVILRDKVGKFHNIQSCEYYLQHWIHQYCAQYDLNEKYPLSFAKIRITKTNTKNGFICNISLKLQKQRESSDYRLFYKT